jgi:hypothetical protein
MVSQSHRICVADSSFSKHLSQVGFSVNPILKRCPFRWQRPVSSPVTHRNWFLFNFNSSLVLLTEGPCRNPFACLSPVKDSQYFLWSLLVQSLTALLAVPTEMPQAGSVLWTDLQIPIWPIDQQLHYAQYPHDLAPISVEPCYVQPVVWEIDGNPRLV